jgi:AAA+ ATPase superfamily predicted ATPase
MRFDKVGKWWSKGVEIDLLALDEEKKEVVFCECKWREKRPDIADLERLREKAAFVNWNKGARFEKFVFFSKSGFDKKTRDYGKSNGWLLVDLVELEECFAS